MIEQIVVATVVHQMSRHRDPLPHHTRQSLHGPIGIDLEELLDDTCVGRLVPLLVGGDRAADFRQSGVAVGSG